MFSGLHRSHSALTLSAERGTSLSFYTNAVHPNSGLLGHFPSSDELSTIVENEMMSMSSSPVPSSPEVSPTRRRYSLSQDGDFASIAPLPQNCRNGKPVEVIDYESVPGSQLGLDSVSPNGYSRGESVEFELLNPTLFLLSWVQSYAERVVGGKREEEDDWFGGLVFHGNVYISFVLFYHLYVHGIGKGDIEWRRLPGYCEISATVPMLVMECRFQVGEVMM